jgi:hypothetical protein
MSHGVTFRRLVWAVAALAFVAGFALFIVSGATTDKGTPGAIRAESAKIMGAERSRCAKLGSYASLVVLRDEGWLHFVPQYNSVVIVPGPHCGTIVIGSPAYQLSSG